ncbi:MAG: 3-oxoacyl-[acyl-carrier-protein] reductase [Spirochaetia bacterium]|nr:3-oxoacyl-[acyl-carrier-protein] reductase [Spirochaetia bacterium]
MGNENKPLAGKAALVTGGARGIGKSIAEDLAEWGSDLVIVDMNQEECDAAASDLSSKYGVKAVGYHCNVTSKEEVDAVGKKIQENPGHLDILINNAGVTRDNLLLRMKEDEWDMVLDVNLKGPFLITQAVLKYLMKAPDGARIVNISSVSGLAGQPGQANYSSSKSGLIGLTKVIAKEYASKGVRCNAICPGFVKTHMTENLPDKIKEATLEAIPLGRMAEVKDISRVVRFLCSEDASYITGNVIRVDGGMLTGI